MSKSPTSGYVMVTLSIVYKFGTASLVELCKQRLAEGEEEGEPHTYIFHRMERSWAYLEGFGVWKS